MLTDNQRKLLKCLNAGDHIIWTGGGLGWKLSRANVRVNPFVAAALIERGLILLSPNRRVGRIGKAGRAELQAEKVAA